MRLRDDLVAHDQVLNAEATNDAEVALPRPGHTGG
jgi:hypothetical protein